MIIVTPILNATVTAIATTCGVGTAYDLGALEDGQKVYAGFHVLSTAAAANTVQFTIWSSSSSGFGVGSPGTTRFTSNAVACRDAQWPAPITTVFASCQRFWRTQWATSCTNSKKALVWMSRNCADPA